MKIEHIGFEAPALIVLGAGATRGEHFVESLDRAATATATATATASPRPRVLPPLDVDFFTQAQRLSKEKDSFVRDLVHDVSELFGNNFSLTMEQYLTHLEQMRNVHDNYLAPGRPSKANPYREMRDNFLRVLWAVLDEAVGWNRSDEGVQHHMKLIRCLQAKDTILSFNYDWLIDDALARFGAHGGQCIWNPTRGYGVRLRESKGKAFVRWACKKYNGTPLRPNDTLLLLKLHGSMNWFPVKGDGNTRLILRANRFRRKGSSQFEIVPPEWQKATNVGVYQALWQRARIRLQKAENIVFIGYSMPETDLPVRALFMVDAKKAPKIKSLVLVNPDGNARKRIRSVLHRRMDADTRVLTFNDLKEFANYLG
jgi:hypothetical protein